MSEVDRRRKYVRNRVLIETARILSPTFSDAVVFLSGAQLELLRNVTQYLNRQDTYVSEYNPGHYLIPTSADYDDILEIIADLEETLMGNPNTIWGYDNRITANENFVKSGAGDLQVEPFSVPEGYVYDINVVAARNADTIVSQEHALYDGSLTYTIAYFDDQPANVFALHDKLSIKLKEGDKYIVWFRDCQDGDAIRVRGWGTQMVVPA